MINSNYYYEVDVIIHPNLEDSWSYFCFENESLGYETLKQQSSGVTVRTYFPEKWQGNSEQLIKDFCLRFAKQEQQIHLVKSARLQYQNWYENWREYFTPIHIEKFWCVAPSFDDSSILKKHLIRIDPGQAFGTGHHESTALMLLAMQEIWSQEIVSVLDFGCGSGILSIAAHKLGATQVYALDIDPIAVQEACINVELNQATSVLPFIGTIDCLHAQYHCILVNMLYNELLENCKHFIKLMNHQSILLCSGILNTQLQGLVDCLEKLGLVLQKVWEKGEWVTVQFHLSKKVLHSSQPCL